MYVKICSVAKKIKIDRNFCNQNHKNNNISNALAQQNGVKYILCFIAKSTHKQ